MSDQVMAIIISVVFVGIVAAPFVWLKLVEDRCNKDGFDW